MNAYFLIACLQAVDGEGMVPSWDPTAMNKPVSRLNKIFLSSHIGEVNLRNLLE
jgi:hypothetical protein